MERRDPQKVKTYPIIESLFPQCQFSIDRHSFNGNDKKSLFSFCVRFRFEVHFSPRGLILLKKTLIPILEVVIRRGIAFISNGPYGPPQGRVVVKVGRQKKRFR